MIPCGLDLGNRRVKLHLLGYNASIPAVIGLEKPVVISSKTGVEVKPKAFSLLFRVDTIEHTLWFGRDVLLSQAILQEIDQSKYTKSHIQRLFQAALYQWSIQHRQDLAQLEKLNVMVSMPPGQYQKPAIKRQAESAYRKAFNTGQAHMQLRDGTQTYQIVTRFAGLQKEAMLLNVTNRNELVLVVDLGGGTTDFVLFNGSNLPIDSRTVNNGLFHAYQKTDYVNPQKIEFRILRDKAYFPNALLSYYNEIKLMIQAITRALPRQPDKIYLIGGGAGLMPRQMQKTFKQLAKEVIIKDQYVNVIANWKMANENSIQS